MRLGARVFYLLIFLSCASLVGYALYLQLVNHLLPCPLCIAQRLAYWLVGLTALFAYFHNSRSFGCQIYSSLIAIFALVGMLVALRHSWLVRYPEAFECGISTEEKFLNALSIAKWWPSMFEANGDCTNVTWEFMSLTIPDWSVTFFILFFILAVYILFSSRNRY